MIEVERIGIEPQISQRAQIKAGGETRHQIDWGFHRLVSAIICVICGQKGLESDRTGSVLGSGE